jgi:putative SOS response-associated peptidase YedK
VCGRYTLTTPHGQLLSQRFEAPEEPAEETLERFNVCPTEAIAVVSASGEDGARVLHTVRWGLVPPWARALGKGHEPINARAETVATKHPFDKLYARPERRCLILADGWYEWLKSETRKGDRIPFRYTVDGGAPFAFAGLWDVRRPAGERVESATILTTGANAVCAPVHDRMPCVLAGPEEEAAWLSGEVDIGALGELLAPLDPARCDAVPANPAVNKAGVEGAKLLTPPAAEPPAQLELGL